MPQTGPDLVGAGYPISRPLLALLGGNSNLVQPNVPIKTNLDFGLGGLVDAALAATGSINAVAVPVSPGDVFTKLSVMVGASAGSPSGWGFLFTGTGSAPGTAGAAPTLIAQSASATTPMAASTLYSFTFTSPVVISAVQAPYGYIYAAISTVQTSTASPSFVAMTAAAATQYPWFPTSPVALYATSGSTTGFATLGTSTKQANPPVVLLS